jgi:hypothetical protein
MEQTDELGRTTTKPNPADEQRQWCIYKNGSTAATFVKADKQ